MSTKGRYGLRAALDIAARASEEAAASSRSISDRTGIPEAYLIQLLMRLRSAGIVESIRGVKGGYVLSRPPEEISVAEVLRAAGESIEPVDCVASGKECADVDVCLAHRAWERLNNGIVRILQNMTIASLLEESSDGCGMSGCKCSGILTNSSGL